MEYGEKEKGREGKWEQVLNPCIGRKEERKKERQKDLISKSSVSTFRNKKI